MKFSSGFPGVPGGVRRWMIIATLTLGLFPFVDKTAYSVVTIVVTGTHGLTFGTIARSGTVTIASSSSNAARFTVTGSKKNDVTLSIIRGAMSTSSGSSSSSSLRQMTPTLSASTCQYSTNNGSTWNNFQGVIIGIVYASTTFPNSGGTTSSILVRVGGSATADSRQQRGSYSGSVTLSASYDNN